ncbi:glutamate-rich protein 6 [Dunckerocampus dactyliophorus]|uniref:glutamate-rich protein 6 n=1 Tax=Dunckerocampus dactyliophorus TaxID=161453 RepID=UPI0024055430|nr:glutamate-rich protein 6 [Dunckerocampus dactyliophorus]
MWSADPPTHCIRAGVLSYYRESDNPRLNTADIHSEPPFEWLGKCEYCNKAAWPLLDVRWEEEMEAVSGFCCTERQKLCMALVKKREQEEVSPTVKPEKPTTQLADALLREKKARSMSLELQRGLRERSGWKSEDETVQHRTADTSSEANVLSFRFGASADQPCWLVNRNLTENVVHLKKEEATVFVCDHKPTPFGICHHKDGEFQQKFYMNGKTFVNMFPDGSAQLFYPSGLMALLVVVTKDKGRVCILYDESLTPHRPIRAIFQSNGMATCYHRNGKIWLSLNRTGGQCLDETSARVRRWTWKTLPTPHLPPLFLSLNRNVGIRVLGKDQVFVSFLANGQQARCSVGSCSAQCKCTKERPSSGPSVLKDELFVLAARVKIHQCIQHLNWSLITPLHQKTIPAPSIRAFGKRLLEVSTNMLMSQHERTFIQGCLHDCL